MRHGLLILATVGALAACGSDDATPAQSAAQAADAVFSDYVEGKRLTKFGDVDDLMALADGICSSFDRGVDWASTLGCTAGQRDRRAGCR
jgi:hypothetical protein